MSGDCFGKVEPIDRNEAIRRFAHMRELTADQVVEMLKRVPSCRPTGEWFGVRRKGEWFGVKCSICGAERAWYGDAPNFCPDCGSDNRERSEDE